MPEASGLLKIALSGAAGREIGKWLEGSLVAGAER